MNKMQNLKTMVNKVKNYPEKNNKSKEAARSRRNRENDEFKFLSALLPLQSEITRQLDKASIIRLTISFLKLKKFYSECNFKNEFPKNFVREKFEINSFMPSLLDGFLFLLGHDGKFLYINESVSSMLGLSQVAMIGTHIYEYIHPDDQKEFSAILGLRKIGKNKAYFDSIGSDYSDDNIEEENIFENSLGINGKKVSLQIRFKSTLMKKSSSSNKSSGWRLVQIIGRLDSCLSNSKIGAGFFGIGLSVETQCLCEIYLQNSTFIIKLDNKLQIESIENFPMELDTNMEAIFGKSIFHLVNPIDLLFVREKLIEVKIKEHGTFSFRLAQNMINNLVCQCNAVLVPKATFLPINGHECSIVESFQIILMNDLYRVDELMALQMPSEISKEIINENYLVTKNINPTSSNEIPEKNLPLKKNKNKMKTTFLNSIDESYQKESLKERARKYFKIETPNVESRYGQEIFEESMYESPTPGQNAFNFEQNRQHLCHSIDYDYQSIYRFGNHDVDYINCYPNGVQDFGRNFDSSQSSQVYWDLVKQDELHSYTNLASFANFSDQI